MAIYCDVCGMEFKFHASLRNHRRRKNKCVPPPFYVNKIHELEQQLKIVTDEKEVLQLSLHEKNATYDKLKHNKLYKQIDTLTNDVQELKYSLREKDAIIDLLKQENKQSAESMERVASRSTTTYLGCSNNSNNNLKIKYAKYFHPDCKPLCDYKFDLSAEEIFKCIGSSPEGSLQRIMEKAYITPNRSGTVPVVVNNPRDNVYIYLDENGTPCIDAGSFEVPKQIAAQLNVGTKQLWTNVECIAPNYLQSHGESMYVEKRNGISKTSNLLFRYDSTPTSMHKFSKIMNRVFPKAREMDEPNGEQEKIYDT